jgi:NAD(P)H-dependent flavin oxidoreductase YrpB (nitropropane dioxygenase family)
MLGTRFLATVESDAHPLYKQALVDAGSTDSVYTLCFDGGWPYAAHRVLRNGTLNAWESAGCPPVGRRPNEGQVIVQDTKGPDLKRYDDAPPLAGMQGDILESCLYAGTGCGQIDDIPPARELLTRIRAEYSALCRDAVGSS